MQRVFVLDADRRPLMPCRPARARWLLTQRRAAVFRRQPFTSILQEARPDAAVTPLRLQHMGNQRADQTVSRQQVHARLAVFSIGVGLLTLVGIAGLYGSIFYLAQTCSALPGCE